MFKTALGFQTWHVWNTLLLITTLQNMRWKYRQSVEYHARLRDIVNSFLSWSKRPAPSGEAFTQLKYWETHQGVQNLTPEQYFSLSNSSWRGHLPWKTWWVARGGANGKLTALSLTDRCCKLLRQRTGVAKGSPQNQWRPPLLAVVDDLLAELWK